MAEQDQQVLYDLYMSVGMSLRETVDGMMDLSLPGDKKDKKGKKGKEEKPDRAAAKGDSTGFLKKFFQEDKKDRVVNRKAAALEKKKSGRKALDDIKPVGLAQISDKGGAPIGFKKFLNKMADKIMEAGAPPPAGEDPDKKEGAGFLKWLIVGAGLIFGGIYAFIKGMMESGPAQGLFKLIGKVGIMGGLLIVAKTIGMTMKPVLKFMPIIGALLDFADGFNRLQKGEIGQGLLAIAAGIFNFLPGFGPWLSLGIGVLQAFIDSNEGAKEFVNEKVGSVIALIMKVFLPFLSILKAVPFIGGLIGLGEAYGYFKSGNAIQGLLSLVGGIAGFFPGIGTGISIGISVLNSILQLTGVSKDLETGEDFSFSEIMNTLFQMVVGMTPVGWIIGFVKGLGLMAKGDIKGGLWKMAEWMGPLGVLANFIFGPEKKPGEISDIQGDKSSIWTTLKKFIFGMSPISWIIGIYKGIKYIFQGKWGLAALSFTYGIPFLSTVLHFLGGPSTAEEASEDLGKKDGFFGSIVNWFLSVFPLSNLLQAYEGIKEVFSGNIVSGLMKMRYAIPFFGSIVSFFGGPGTAEEATEDIGNKNGFFAGIKNWFLDRFPVKHMVSIWGGIKSVFAGDMTAAGTQFKEGGLWLVGNLISFFTGSGDAEAGKDEKAPSIWDNIKTAVFKKFKVAWEMMPKFVRWMARKILPNSIVSALDNPVSEATDMPHTGSPAADAKPQDPYKAALQSVIAKFKPVWHAMPGFARWIARKVLPSIVIDALDNPTSDDTDVPTEGSPAPEAKPMNPYTAALKAVVSKFRPIWNFMPGFARWIARKVLPPALIEMIDGSDDESDVTTEGSSQGEAKPQNPYMAALKAVVSKFRPIWNFMPGFARWIARKVLPHALVQMLDSSDDESDVQTTGSAQAEGRPVDPYKAALQSVVAKFKPIWKAMPGFARWIARKVLPHAIVEMIDNPTKDETDVTTTGSAPAEGKPVDPYMTAMKSVVSKFKPIWNLLPGFTRWIARKVLPSALINMLDSSDDESDVTTAGSPQAEGKPINPYIAALKAVVSKFKPVWNLMPGFARWIARKVLPHALVQVLDSSDDESDVQTTGSAPAEGKPVDPYKAALKSVIAKFKPIWHAMPGFGRWIARKVLPHALVQALDNPTSDETDVVTTGTPETEGQPVDAHQQSKNAILNAYRKVWNGMPAWMKWIAKKVLPKELVASLENETGGDIAEGPAGVQAKAMGDVGEAVDKSAELLIKAGRNMIRNIKFLGRIMVGGISHIASHFRKVMGVVFTVMQRVTQIVIQAGQQMVKKIWAILISANRWLGGMIIGGGAKDKDKAGDQSDHIDKQHRELMAIEGSQLQTLREIATNMDLLRTSAGDLTKMFGLGRGAALTGGAFGREAPAIEIISKEPLKVRVIELPQVKESTSDFEQSLLTQNEQSHEDLMTELREGQIVTLLGTIEMNTRSILPLGLGGGGPAGKGHGMNASTELRQLHRLQPGFNHLP